MGDTLWVGHDNDKIFKNSGFTSSVVDSFATGAVDADGSGVSSDDTDCHWCGYADDKLYRSSGFTATISNSVSVGAVDIIPSGISWDGTNSLWCGGGDKKLYKQSGFTSTMSTSVDVSGVDANPRGITWDGTHCEYCGEADDKLYKQSGFTSTLSTSIDVNGIDIGASGISWDRRDAIWCGLGDDKLYKQSRFTSTMVTSVDISGTDGTPYGIGWSSYSERAGIFGYGILTGIRYSPGVRVRHASKTRRIGEPVMLSGGPPVTPRFLCMRSYPGVRVRHEARVRQVGPHLIDFARRYATFRGKHRIFNDAEYRFYRSSTAPPAETDTPFATNASLPHEPSDTYGEATWYLSVSYFNGVLDSGFLPVGPNGETYLRLDISGGAETNAPPNAPADVRLVKKANGVIRILAFYWQTGSLRAGQWAICYTTDGSTPAEDTPDETVNMNADEDDIAQVQQLEILDYDLPAQADGTTVKVRVQVRRDDGGGTYSYSDGSEVLTETADATGPSAPVAGDVWPGRLPERN